MSLSHFQRALRDVLNYQLSLCHRLVGKVFSFREPDQSPLSSNLRKAHIRLRHINQSGSTLGLVTNHTFQNYGSARRVLHFVAWLNCSIGSICFISSPTYLNYTKCKCRFGGLKWTTLSIIKSYPMYQVHTKRYGC
jgi:hypothetical protein